MTEGHRRLRILSSQTLYKGRVVQLKLDRVVEPNGVTAQREVVCHGGSVVVVPRLPDGRVVLVRQYRYATRRWLWELVAGGMERGETAQQAARRELLEETGYRAQKVTFWCDFYSSPGFLTERMFLLEARGLRRSKARPEADECIEVGQFAPTQLLRMLRNREIRDGKTLVGILWLLHRGLPRGSY